MSDLLIAIKTVEDALDQIGIYPAGVIKNYGTPEQEEIPRSTWQDGWNSCNMEIGDKIYHQLELLKKGADENFAILSVIDAGWVNGDSFVLNMSDTFHYACADAEVITKEQAKEVVRLFKKHGMKGIDYWVAEQRGYDPEIPFYKERVIKVRLEEKGRVK